MTKLTITGMTCEHCQHAVKEALESVAGSDQVQVDLEAGSAVVGGSPDLSALIVAVEEEGYQATPAD